MNGDALSFISRCIPRHGMLGDNCVIINAPRTSHRSPFGILERTFHQLMSCTSAPLWPPWVERPGVTAVQVAVKKSEHSAVWLSQKKLLSFVFFFFAGYCRLLQTSTNTSLSVLKHLAAMLQGKKCRICPGFGSFQLDPWPVCLPKDRHLIQHHPIIIDPIIFVCFKRALMINLA